MTNKTNKIRKIEIKAVRRQTKFDEIKFTGPDTVAEFLHNIFKDVDREMFLVLCLDTKNQLNAYNIVSTGSLNSSIVHPRETFKPAILSNAASIILAHNHPSGDPTPSREDISITDRLVEAGEILGIKVLDHIIVGYENFYSLKSHNKMQ